MKINIVKESSYTRRLKTLDSLDSVLESVSKFKAFNKLKDACSEKFHAYCFEKSHIGIDFHFSALDRSLEDISFRVSAKDIPSIREAALEYRERLTKWIKEENEIDFSLYTGRREIEQKFSEELTPAQFENSKIAVVKYLKTLIKEISELKQ